MQSADKEAVKAETPVASWPCLLFPLQQALDVRVSNTVVGSVGTQTWTGFHRPLCVSVLCQESPNKNKS